MTRLVSGAAVVAVTAGSALLVSSGVASANPPAGTLGFSTVAPDPGTNLSPMSSTTSAGCPTTSTKADLQVVGPIGVDPAQQVFPASNPYTAVTITDTQFSSFGPFTQQWRATFQDAVAERGKTTVPTGEYDFTTTCLDRLGFNTFGTFVGGLNFDTPTHYTGLPGATSSSSPTPSPSPTPTPTPGASPTPSPSPGASPSPTPTDSPAPTDSPTPSPTPDSTTTTPTTTMNDFGGTTTPPDTGGGTQPVASTGALASTGAPTAAMFLGGVILLAAGLVLVVWLRRPGRRP
ncbi:MAG: hypothetical protein WB735_16445 [Pseudonocardiaceae bacterium]